MLVSGVSITGSADRSAAITSDKANLTRAETGERARRITDVAHDVTLDLSRAPDASTSTFPSRSRVSFTIAAGASTPPATWLDLLAPAVDAITVNGQSVDPDDVFDGARITLTAADGLRLGTNNVEVEAQCDYSHTGEGMHRFTDPVDGRTYLYTQYEPADARRVFATFEQPSLKGPFTFHVVAPHDWEVRSNTAGTTTRIDPATARWDFAPTLPIATYITTVLAGPYHVVEDHWHGTASDGTEMDVPLAVLCRQALRASLDADEVVAITKQGLDFFHSVFDLAYPFGRYDQAFVPEYNLGAMENPGLVTLTESYLFQSAVTDAERERRASTILHEMAHMWFGDLVTMQWWDDLWLKESFADFMGTLGIAEATRFTDAWTTFATSDKARAARQDQLPTTHPIVADITDLEAAKLNFDGITYSKGASVLKQLVAWVGRDAFMVGANDYFRRHAWGTTTLDDFLVALESTSGRDLRAWSRVWLETAGVSEVRVEVDVAGPQSPVTAARLAQAGRDPATELAVLRPHRISVGGYDVRDGGLVRTVHTTVDLADGEIALDGLVGRPRPDLILPNDDDLTYAKVVLDPASLDAVRSHLSTIEDSLARAVVWSALWDATRDAHMPAAAFLDTVSRHGPSETHPGIIANLHGQARRGIQYFLPASRRSEFTRQLHTTAVEAAHAAASGSDRQLAWTRLAISLAGDRTEWLEALLDGRGVPKGLVLDADLRWAVWVELAASGRADRAQLDTELARKDTARTRRQHAMARAATPSVEAKDWAYNQLVTRRDLASESVAALAAGWGRADQRELTARFAAAYIDGLSDIWATHSIAIARRLVVVLFPPARDAIEGVAATDHPTVAAVDDWLDGHADDPASLRRLVIEQRDHLVRSLRAQDAGT